MGNGAVENLSREVKLAQDYACEDRTTENRQREAQKRADQKIFREVFGLEFGITRNGFGGQDQSSRTRRLQQQGGEQHKALEPTDVQAGVLHRVVAFFLWIQLDAFRQRTLQGANQIAAAKNQGVVNEGHHHQLARSGAPAGKLTGSCREERRQ